MNKKISLGLSLSLIILSITVTFAVTMAMSKTVYNKIINNLSLRTSASEAIEEISEIVSNYFFGTVDDRTAIITASLVEGYVEGLGDSNSRYLSSEEYADYTDRINGKLSGIGIDCVYDNQLNSLIVAYVYDGSPAETAGLEQGDKLIEIADTKVTKKNYSSLISQLYGSKLNSVKILYERDGETDTVEPMLGFEIPTVTSSVHGSIARVRISSFYKDTPAEFADCIKGLQESSITSFIIDLRNTSEGTLEYAAQTLDVLVPASASGRYLAATYDKNGNRLSVFTAESNSVVASYAVLVNSSTAGPAELFACDLRDISSAKTVGTATAGIGTYQKAYSLSSGDAVMLTVARIEPYNAESVYDGKGIEPDYVCEMQEPSNVWLLSEAQDVQLKQALELLQ